jgi:hypothetical protein
MTFISEQSDRFAVTLLLRGSCRSASQLTSHLRQPAAGNHRSTKAGKLTPGNYVSDDSRQAAARPPGGCRDHALSALDGPAGEAPDEVPL